MAWFEPGPATDAFRAAVGRGEWMLMGFDWASWLQTVRIARRAAALLLASH